MTIENFKGKKINEPILFDGVSFGEWIFMCRLGQTTQEEVPGLIQKTINDHNPSPEELFSWLVDATRYNHLGVVKFLIPLSDPKQRNSLPLRLASLYSLHDIFDALYPHSNPKSALQQMISAEENQERMVLLKQRIQSEEEHKILSDCVAQKSSVTPKKM